MAEFSVFPTAYWAQHYAERTAFVWRKGNSALFSFLPPKLSWLEFHQLVCQTAYYFGFYRFDFRNKTVVFIGEHRLAGLLCYLSVIACGGRILLLNPALKDIQKQAILADIGADSVITDSDFADFLPNMPACLLPEFDSALPSTLTLTSGSSGNPKAVVHSVTQHLANAKGVCDYLNFEAQHCWLFSLPLFHVSGQGIVWRWLLKGATLALCEDKSYFYQLLQTVSHASLVPTQLQRYLAMEFAPKSQHILLGGTYLPPELIKEAQAKQIITYAGYGMTEMASTICAAINETDNVGKPLAGREVKLVKGEIYLRGDCLALGYWQKGKLLPLFTQNGWFASKDEGEWNSNGQLKIIGRRDNLFISGGENIQPEQVEQCLYQSGLVKQIFILPKHDWEFGQRPVALVEFIGEFSLQAVEKLQQFAKQELERFKQPIAYYPLKGEQWQQGIKLSRKQLQNYVNTL